MQSNVALDVEAWFVVFDEYFAEKTATIAGEPHLLELLLQLREELLGTYGKWQVWKQMYSEAIIKPEVVPLVVSDANDDWYGDETISLLVRHHCEELRFGRRPVRSQARITSRGEIEADSGMLMASVEGWIYAIALEQKDAGCYKSDRVEPLKQVDVWIDHQWVKLCDFLAEVQSGDTESSPVTSV